MSFKTDSLPNVVQTADSIGFTLVVDKKLCMKSEKVKSRAKSRVKKFEGLPK